jgi:hypothetical protein
VICPKCGESNSDQYRFCGMCGTLLQATRQSAPLGRPSASPFPAAPAAAIPRSTPVPKAEPAQRDWPAEQNSGLNRSRDSNPNLDLNLDRKIDREAESRRPLIEKNAVRPAADVVLKPAERYVPPISGPSMLGLNQPLTAQPEEFAPPQPRDRATFAERSGGRPSLDDRVHESPSPGRSDFNSREFDSGEFDDVSGDSVREQSFSGLDSYIEAEQNKSGAGRVLLLVVLLAALGVAGWWAYNNYVGLTQKRKAASDTAGVIESPSESASSKAATPDATLPPASSAPKPATPPSSDIAEGPSENAGSTAEATPPPANADATPPKNVAPPKAAAAPKPAAVAKAPAARKVTPKREPATAAAKSSRMPAAEPADTGDASFRKAEAYLYGRGAAQNCDEAIKNLKEASAKSNAKARSTFGTLYATGHCVPRDLPTSYLWFAMALRVDPNNQILEKDLTAVWNQMTPPERQMAARMKQ